MIVAHLIYILNAKIAGFGAKRLRCDSFRLPPVTSNDKFEPFHLLTARVTGNNMLDYTIQQCEVMLYLFWPVGYKVVSSPFVLGCRHMPYLLSSIDARNIMWSLYCSVVMAQCAWSAIRISTCQFQIFGCLCFRTNFFSIKCDFLFVWSLSNCIERN